RGVDPSVVADEGDRPYGFSGDTFGVPGFQDPGPEAGFGEESHRGSRIVGSGIRDDDGGSGHGHLHWATGPKNGQYSKNYLLLPRGTSVPSGFPRHPLRVP